MNNWLTDEKRLAHVAVCLVGEVEAWYATVWYQVEGRDPAKLRAFLGQDIDDLRRAVTNDSKLEVAPNELTLFVKDPNSGQEVKLNERLRKKYGDFSNLISVYEIDDENPVVVRVPPGTYIL